MNSRHLLLISLLLSLSASCNKNVDEGTVWDNPRFIRIKASSEAVSDMGNMMQPEWSVSDTLLVFDENGEAVKLGTNDPLSKVFFSYDWTRNSPGYAVYPASAALPPASTAVPGVSVPSGQAVSETGVLAPIISVGRIEGNKTAYRLEPMSNVTGFVKVSMADSTASSISIEPLAAGEVLCGNVDVDYTAMKEGQAGFWTARESEAASGKVSISPVPGSSAETTESCLKAGSYYAAVLPQTYSDGLKISVIYKDGSRIERTLVQEGGLTVPRSGVVEFEGTLDDTLPDEVIISLDFYNENDVNPLGKFASGMANQKAAGETYKWRYDYLLDGNPMSKEFSFVVSKGNEANAEYRFSAPSGLSHNVLFTTKNNSWIKLPGIPGRYLKSVSMSHDNTFAKRFRVQEESPDNGPVGKYYSSPNLKANAANDPVVETVTFPTGSSDAAQINSTVQGKSYTMQFTAGASLRIWNITLVYSKSLDE